MKSDMKKWKNNLIAIRLGVKCFQKYLNANANTSKFFKCKCKYFSKVFKMHLNAFAFDPISDRNVRAHGTILERCGHSKSGGHQILVSDYIKCYLYLSLIHTYMDLK